MGKVLVRRDKNYGCFIAGFNCSNCRKTVVTKELSYSNNKVSINDVNKITEILENKMSVEEIIFCRKCGNKL